MENELHRRDHIGVQDFVLLEDYTNQSAVVENLRKRFNENLIYTYIGPVLVSVNPYKQLDIYSQEFIETYRNVNFYELPPHVYSIADAACRSMHGEHLDQCILISGESGSGKTEASKKILQYIASTSSHSIDVERVKDRLLQSNPLLEAFGNAKTNRNDNSSRFGKYMDIQFDFKRLPVGGHILNYLLEKSRVVHQAEGERNFHIFYQLLKGGTPLLLNKLKLQGDPDQYYYLKQGDSVIVDTLNDNKDFQVVKRALDVCDFDKKEQDALFAIVSTVLHLGNIKFHENKHGMAEIDDLSPVEIVSQLLGCEDGAMESALQNKTIEARGEKLKSPLNKDQALYARDALSKGIYDRLFTYVVSKINLSLSSKWRRFNCNLIGLLDIYGFEIFETNCFEQFCINYCNEKLQQLFIELTLKSEQEEYQREGIEWEPVHYFNNKIICDMVEAKPVGIIAIMDEECLRPGDPTDQTFLLKLSDLMGNHPHFVSHSTASDNIVRKTIKRDEFRLMHYAGDVTYKVKGFLDKNNDLFFRDLKEVMSQTTNPIICKCFPKKELQEKKRPNTTEEDNENEIEIENVLAATQFKASLSKLMEILMSKEPSYVRCIKPNDYKKAGVFDDKIVNHQVKYLGLMENLRVRRAGFAYRRPYEVFLKRYKSLCPATWPKYDGEARDGVELLVKHLNYTDDDYRLGKTKLFIRFPRVLFATEDAFQARKQDLATVIQAKYRCHHARKQYLRIKLSAIIVQAHWRSFAAKKKAEKRRWAVQIIRKFVKGFIFRKRPECEENKDFIQYTKYNYLTRLTKSLPTSVLNKHWLQPPALLQETSELLRRLCVKNLILQYVKKITPVMKHQFEQKVIAEKLFKQKKLHYSASVPVKFVDSHLTEELESFKSSVFDSKIKKMDEKLQYSAIVTKYDRHGYKARKRVMLLTEKHLYLLNQKDFALKDQLSYENISGVATSCLDDGVFILEVDNQEISGSKGDLILHCDYLIEAVTKLAIIGKKIDAVRVIDEGSVSHRYSGGKQGCIEFTKGSIYSVKKGKNGHLVITA